MTEEYILPMRGGAPSGSPAQYDMKSIARYLKSSDPGAVADAGQAYLRFAGAYQRITQSLAQAGRDLDEAWRGTDASAAQVRMRGLWASSHTISATAQDFGTAIERHGSEYLSWYRNSMPQPKNDAEARSWMQGANERITETWSALPPDISTPFYTSRTEHGAPIGTGPGSGAEAPGSSGGSGGISPGSASPGGSGAAGSPGAATPVPGSGNPTSPSHPTAPIGAYHPGQQPNSTPALPSAGHPAGQGTDLSGVAPPGTGGPDNGGPGVPPVSASPPGSGTGPQAPGAGGSIPGIPGGGTFGPPRRAGAGLPGGAAIGLPTGGYGSPRSGGQSGIGGLNRSPVNENGPLRNGVIGRAPSTQASAMEEAGAARSGPAAMGPMAGAGGSSSGSRERQRQAWVGEEPDLWNEDIEVSPSVLGAEPRRTTHERGRTIVRGGGFQHEDGLAEEDR